MKVQNPLEFMPGIKFAADGIRMGSSSMFIFIGAITSIAAFGLIGLVRMIPGIKKILYRCMTDR